MVQGFPAVSGFRFDESILDVFVRSFGESPFFLSRRLGAVPGGGGLGTSWMGYIGIAPPRKGSLVHHGLGVS